MRKMLSFSLFALAAMPFLPAQEGEVAAADAPTVDQIIAAANRVSYYQGKDGRAQVKMEIVDSQGRKRVREMTILRRDEPAPDGYEPPEDLLGGEKAKADAYCAKQRFYVRFRRPADVARTTFLVWKNPGKDDDRWLFLPALDLVKRVSSADKRSSFVGSNFFYEDVSGRHPSADEHRLVETTKNYYVIESKPKDPKSVEFASYKMWVHKASFTVVKVEYSDKKGEVYRIYEALAVDEVQGYPTVTKARMRDLRTKGSTTATYTSVAYDIGLPEDIFTERYLRRAPRRYMR